MSPQRKEDGAQVKEISRCFPQTSISLLLIISLVTPVQGFSLRSCRISGSITQCHPINKLNAVPRDIPSTSTELDLTQNNIQIVQSDDFKNLPSLKRLLLGKNAIAEIKKGAFADLNSLRTLNLYDNKLNQLGENVFQGLSCLTTLIINQNHIAEVAPMAFTSMKMLKKLDISNNKLHSVTQLRFMLQHLPYLQHLLVSANNLTTFRSWELTNRSLQLVHLTLSQNPFHVFSVSADVFPHLTELRLGGSCTKQKMHLDVRNKTFLSRVSDLNINGTSMDLADMKDLLQMMNSSLTSLTMNRVKQDLGELINASCSIQTMSKLYLKYNNCFKVSVRLFRQCVNIKILDLTGNRIEKISDGAFRSLSGLEELNLFQNNLLRVPAAIKDLAVLTKLDLSACEIKILQCEDFANNTKLRQLILNNNKISKLSECLFRDLQELQILKLMMNQITKIGDAFKSPLPNLKTLYLNRNKIKEIKNGELKGLIALQNLSFYSNEIKKIKAKSFIGLTNLKTLLLQFNRITEDGLQTGAFNVLINLERLDLTNNKIRYGDDLALPMPPFSNLSKLQDLSLRGQRRRLRSYLPRNLLQGLSNLLRFNVRSNRLPDVHRDVFQFTPRLEKLDINANSHPDISPNMFSSLRNLRSLYISNAAVGSMDFFIRANLTKLQYVQAKENQFSVIQKEVIQSLPALAYIDITNNSFNCDCENEWFIQWVRNSTQTQVYGAYDFTCNHPPALSKTKLLDFMVQQCSRATNFIFFVTTTSAVLCLTVVPLVYYFMGWQLVYAYYIFLAWLVDAKHRKKTPHQYDAFVSYNVHDEPWVFGQLLPNLEEQQGWKLCLHHRDFQPGKPIIDNIIDAIYGSRKTICVVSYRYLESEWCSREIQAASFRLFDENKDVLILVFLEDIPNSQLSPFHRMRKLLKRQTYLSWPKAGENVQVFWEKLRQALQTGQDVYPEKLNLLAATD